MRAVIIAAICMLSAPAWCGEGKLYTFSGCSLAIYIEEGRSPSIVSLFCIKLDVRQRRPFTPAFSLPSSPAPAPSPPL